MRPLLFVWVLVGIFIPQTLSVRERGPYERFADYVADESATEIKDYYMIGNWIVRDINLKELRKPHRPTQEEKNRQHAVKLSDEWSKLSEEEKDAMVRKELDLAHDDLNNNAYP